MARFKGFACSVAAGGLDGPSSPLTIETELLEPEIHGNAAAGLPAAASHIMLGPRRG